MVILAGGRGTRLSEDTHAVPKPMINVGGRPIIWHIMRHYASFGFTDFVVACGYKGEVLKDYFASYYSRQSDLRVDLGTGAVEALSPSPQDWTVTLVDTGQATGTGGRLKRLAHLLTDRFLMTYGDGLSDVPLDALLSHHQSQAAAATLTAVHPLPRWGALTLEDDRVRGFREKPLDPHSWINGGYFVLEPEVLDLIPGDETNFEGLPMETLSTRDALAAYRHEGFWMAMDTARDRDELNNLWDDGSAPWAPTE